MSTKPITPGRLTLDDNLFQRRLSTIRHAVAATQHHRRRARLGADGRAIAVAGVLGGVQSLRRSGSQRGRGSGSVHGGLAEVGQHVGPQCGHVERLARADQERHDRRGHDQHGIEQASLSHDKAEPQEHDHAQDGQHARRKDTAKRAELHRRIVVSLSVIHELPLAS